MLYNLSARESGGFFFILSIALLFIPKFQAKWLPYLITQVITLFSIILLFLPVYRIHGFRSDFNFIEWIKAETPNVSTQNINVIPRKNVNALFYNFEKSVNTFNPSYFFILLHGGGFSSGIAEHMNKIGGFLASEGIPAFSLNYSLAPKESFPKQTQEIDSLLKEIRSKSQFAYLHNKEFILLGESAGATIALNYAYLKPDSALKMVINLYGLTDPGFVYPESANSNAKLQEMVTSYQGWASVDEISPLRNASRLGVPVYTFHGSEDVIVPQSQASVFHEKRKQLGFTKDSIFILKGATHLFDHPLTGPSGQFLKSKIKQMH